MPRRSSSRRRESDLEKAVMAALLLPVLCWLLVPGLRPVMVIGGGILLLGGIGWLIYRYNQLTGRTFLDHAD
jgi:hypothetical protein